MHVKMKFLACVLTVAMIFSSITCFANQENTSYDLVIEEMLINNDSGKVTVSGTAKASKVTMIVYKPDNSGNALLGVPTQGNIDTMVYTIDEMPTGENGSFTFSFVIPESKPGKYRVRIGVKGKVFSDSAAIDTDDVREGTVKRLGFSDKAAIINSFVGAETASALDTFFTNNSDLFTLPDFYGPATYEAFNNIVIEYKNTYYQTGVAKTADIADIINVSEKVKELSEITTAEGLSSFIGDSENSSSLGIDTGDEYYLDAAETDVSKKNKTLVDNKIFSLVSAAATPVAKWKAIEDNFKTTVILTAFNNALKTEFDGMLKKYHLDLNIQVSHGYLSIDPIEMGKALYNKGFTALSEIKTLFDSTLAALSSPGNSGGNDGVSSSPSRSDRDYKVSGGGIVPVINNGFTDLALVPWATEAITALKNKGIIDGMTPTQFAPNSFVTREQFVKLVVEAFGSQWTKGNNGFTDVSSSTWYADYVSRAVNAGVINGQSDAIFGVGKNITRQDVAVILYRIMKDKFSAPAVDPSFKDWNSVSSYAKDAVAAMWSEKILSGDDKGCFNPQKSCTRAEAAKLIYGALALVEGV